MKLQKVLSKGNLYKIWGGFYKVLYWSHKTLGSILPCGTETKWQPLVSVLGLSIYEPGISLWESIHELSRQTLFFPKAHISQFKLKVTPKSSISILERCRFWCWSGTWLGSHWDTQRDPPPSHCWGSFTWQLTLFHNSVFFSYFPTYYSQQSSTSSAQPHIVLCLSHYAKTQVYFSSWKFSSIITSSTTFSASLLNIPIIFWPCMKPRSPLWKATWPVTLSYRDRLVSYTRLVTVSMDGVFGFHYCLKTVYSF